MVDPTRAKERRTGIIAVAAALLLAVVFHRPLIDWFTLEPAGSSDPLAAAHGGHAPGDDHRPIGAPPPEHDEISHYTCPMHPWVKEQDPKKKCPVCSMDLAPVTREEVRTGIIRMDQARRNELGVRTATIGRGSQRLAVRVIGEVTYDQSSLADVTLKLGGWVKDLRVDETGARVKRGTTLFTLYSPELFAAQQEYLVALEDERSATTEARRARAGLLLRAAKKRLQLLDVSDSVIARIAARKKPLQYVPVSSPASGYVVEKTIVEGGAVKPGERLYRIAALDRVWIEGRVYERDLPRVARGQEARVTLPHLPGRSFEGKVTFIYPYVDAARRTARVRIELDNPGRVLKPNMYADVALRVDRGQTLQVPESAIVFAGRRRIAFVDVGGDRFRPTLVKLGNKSGSFYPVRGGLEAGDRVAVSGLFLLAAESRLKATKGIW